MNADEMLKTLTPWLVRMRRPGWKPVVRDGDGFATGSKFGGVAWTGPEAPWPVCGSCGEPLTPFLQLDLDDLPEELGARFGSGLLQLFYCVGEDCDDYDGWKPFGDEVSRVRVVRPTGSEPIPLPPSETRLMPEKAVIDWERFEDLPDPEEHDENGLVYSYDFERGTLRFECPEVGLDHEQRMSECRAEEIANAKLGDKLGGWAAWIQGVEYPDCPTCGQRMVLVFQLDSEHNVPFMFGDAGCGHVTQCPEHKDVVAFGWACC